MEKLVIKEEEKVNWKNISEANNLVEKCIKEAKGKKYISPVKEIDIEIYNMKHKKGCQIGLFNQMDQISILIALASRGYNFLKIENGNLFYEKNLCKSLYLAHMEKWGLAEVKILEMKDELAKKDKEITKLHKKLEKANKELNK